MRARSNATSASERSASTRCRTSSRCARDTSAPICVLSSAGSPTRTSANRATSASVSASSVAAGAMTRRMAVHFCPAFAVISRTTSSRKSSNFGVPGTASGPSREAFRLSCSAMKVTERPSRFRFERRVSAVSALPVKLTTSWASSRSRRSPVPPTISCTAPPGRMPDSAMRLKQAAATCAVAVAGFVITGMPARMAGASFSSMPHTGKLNALMCTAAPRFGTATCWPMKVPPRDSASTSPSSSTCPSGSSRRPFEA